MFETLEKADFVKTLKLFILVVLTPLMWFLALLILSNSGSGAGATLALWGVTGVAMTLSVLVVVRLVQRIASGIRQMFHTPLGVRIDGDGVHQSGAADQDVDLKWEDIRIIQHKGLSHTIRGADKSQRIEISTRLEGHAAVSSFLKFAFLLRQEAGEDWNGLLHEVQARLAGTGFHFHYDSDRTNTVFIDNQGIKHSSGDGVEAEMSWQEMRQSSLERQKDHLHFRHKGSKSSLAIPRGTDSDDIIEELIRWALHTAPDFSSSLR